MRENGQLDWIAFCGGQSLQILCGLSNFNPDVSPGSDECSALWLDDHGADVVNQNGRSWNLMARLQVCDHVSCRFLSAPDLHFDCNSELELNFAEHVQLDCLISAAGVSM